MISKQLVLGGTLLLGGSVALFALTQKNTHNESATISDEKAMTAKQDSVARPTVQPLTTDLETERRLLEQKRLEREARTQEQERQTQALLEAQEKAKADALQKAQAEIDAKKQAQQAKQDPQGTDDSTPAVLTVQTRPEILKAEQEAKEAEAKKLAEKQEAQRQKAEAEKKRLTAEQTKKQNTQNSEQNKTKEPTPKKDNKENTNTQNNKTTPHKEQHTIKQGDTLIKLSHQYGIPVSVIASANNMGRHDALAVGKTIKIPTKAEADKIARANANKTQADKQNQQKTNKADDKKPAEQANTKKSNKVPRHYSVQVAMLPKDKANALAKEYRQAGYKVQTSQTSRGVRVLVGHAKTEAEANTLKNKIIKDTRVKTDGAWVKEVDEINKPQ
ncbi:MAG: LysM peptidoglycan-binding domain-containing protein [Moraxella sp.]|nr:LysM peptidoglycan-binding domain-containing protein [Moraxella sp.]